MARQIWAAVIGLGVVASAQGANWTVTDVGDAGDGNCDASCTLRDAVNAANTDDRILFDLALPAPILIGLTGSALQIDVPLRITATDGVRTTLRRVAGSGRLMELTGSADARIIGLQFEDGGAPTMPGLIADGGAVHVATGTTLELRDCVFRNNIAYAGIGVGGGPGETARGGAIYAAGDLLVENCAFLANRATGGAPAPFGNSGGAALGGAIHAVGSLTVLNATFSGNQANGGSGSIGFIAGLPNFPGGMGGGGGLAAGGAIAVANGADATVAFSTMIANTVTGGPGGPGGFGMPPGGPGITGPANSAALATTAPTILNTSVIAANSGGAACSGAALTARTSNLVDDGSCPGQFVAALAGQFLAIDVAALSPNYMPLDSSAAVDASTDCLDALGAEAVDLDQVLAPRPMSALGLATACDFGAIELNPVLFADGFEEPPAPP